MAREKKMRLCASVQKTSEEGFHVFILDCKSRVTSSPKATATTQLGTTAMKGAWSRQCLSLPPHLRKKMGGSVVTLQKILRHSSLDITENYLNLLTTDLKKNMVNINIIRSLNQDHVQMRKDFLWE